MSQRAKEKSRAYRSGVTGKVTELSHRDNGLPRELMAEMERLLVRIPPEAQWTVKTVGEELTFAIRLCNKAVGRVLPADSKAAWPTILRDWADLIAQVDSEEGVKEDEPRRFFATRAQINRMERALVWQARYLARPQDETLRKVLAIWLRSRSRRGGSFNQSLKRLGVARPTAYRARDRALLLIALGLMRDGVPPTN